MIDRPKAQRLYVDTVTGVTGAFDSWQSWPERGYYRLSSRKFVVLRPARMRTATAAECRAFARARSVRVECSA